MLLLSNTLYIYYIEEEKKKILITSNIAFEKTNKRLKLKGNYTLKSKRNPINLHTKPHILDKSNVINIKNFQKKKQQKKPLIYKFICMQYPTLSQFYITLVIRNS